VTCRRLDAVDKMIIWVGPALVGGAHVGLLVCIFVGLLVQLRRKDSLTKWRSTAKICMIESIIEYIHNFSEIFCLKIWKI
jgi:hypothetical protein